MHVILCILSFPYIQSFTPQQFRSYNYNVLYFAGSWKCPSRVKGPHKGAWDWYFGILPYWIKPWFFSIWIFLSKGANYKPIILTKIFSFRENLGKICISLMIFVSVEGFLVQGKYVFYIHQYFLLHMYAHVLYTAFMFLKD